MFHVWVRTTGDSTFASNAREFDTQAAAVAAANSLFDRWFAVEDWAVCPADVVPVGQFHTPETIRQHAVAAHWRQ